eukprot:359418-Chlamydomonas_euryale.AAC.2
MATHGAGVAMAGVDAQATQGVVGSCDRLQCGLKSLLCSGQVQGVGEEAAVLCVQGGGEEAAVLCVGSGWGRGGCCALCRCRVQGVGEEAAVLWVQGVGEEAAVLDQEGV